MTTDYATAARASLELARSTDPDVLAAQIAAQNTPEKLAALQSRLARYRRNRLAAEAAYYAEHGR